MQPLGERGGQHGRSHAGEHRLMVAELTRAHDGQELVGADARRGVAHGVSSRARSRAAASAASPKSARYSAWVAGP